MHTRCPRTLLPCLALALVTTAASCDEAVVGRDHADEDVQALCEELGRRICEQACACGGADGCNVGLTAGETPSYLAYDDLEACEESFVTFACLNPPNPASYYEDCAEAVESCTDIPDGATTVGAADLSPACQNPNGFGVSCGADHCPQDPAGSPDNEHCCVVVDGDTSTPMCIARDVTCESLNLRLACDGPEDCGGSACCGTVVDGVACTDEPACPDDIAQYCHTSSDCPNGSACLPATYAGFEIHVCTTL